ncbi:MAG: UDP-N-acetylglucosamine 2-epimerase (non-hydrolyzing) [Filomicrobium sp.]
MKRINVMTVLGTRPEMIRLSRVMACLDKYTDHTIVHTGQNYDYELNEIFLGELEIRKPNHYLGAAGQSAAETIGNVIIRFDSLLAVSRPDAVLVLGDTNSCLAALPAKRRKIPIFHMEAGNRCFDMRVPEEINRRIVDTLADVNLTYSDIAREYLLAEGFPADRIIKTGSPMYEVLNAYRDKIEASEALEQLDIAKHAYILVSCHREENVDDPVNLARFAQILNGLAKHYNFPVIMSTHPRTRQRLAEASLELHPLVKLLKPFGFPDYVRLQADAFVVLSDSGTITEESSILNFPAINIRDAHERPEGFEEGAVMMTGFNYERILQAIDILADQPRGSKRLLRQVSDYSMDNVSDKVLRIIMSYTDYARRVVWSSVNFEHQLEESFGDRQQRRKK